MADVSQSALDNLLEAARRAASMSYSPYSGFRVGAALRLAYTGQVVTGTNVENVSFWPDHLRRSVRHWCAHVSEFGPKIRIEAVAVANLNGAASPPCGACRQMLAEFAEPGTPIVFPAASGTRTMRFDEVLPLGFDMNLKAKDDR